MRFPTLSACVMLLIAACSSRAPQPEPGNAVNRVAVGNDLTGSAVPDGSNPSPVDGTPGTPGGLPDDRTLLEEPSGPIDPKSAEGAGQVVQRYGGLLEQRKFAEARRLWGDGGNASGLTEAQFVKSYDKYATIHSEIGRPTDMEGAAGSSYITVPFRLYGTLKTGREFNLVGPLTLRRVNDVPGSTEEQRRWHIEKSGLESRP